MSTQTILTAAYLLAGLLAGAHFWHRMTSDSTIDVAGRAGLSLMPPQAAAAFYYGAVLLLALVVVVFWPPWVIYLMADSILRRRQQRADNSDGEL